MPKIVITREELLQMLEDYVEEHHNNTTATVDQGQITFFVGTEAHTLQPVAVDVVHIPLRDHER